MISFVEVESKARDDERKYIQNEPPVNFLKETKEEIYQLVENKNWFYMTKVYFKSTGGRESIILRVYTFSKKMNYVFKSM